MLGLRRMDLVAVCIRLAVVGTFHMRGSEVLEVVYILQVVVSAQYEQQHHLHHRTRMNEHLLAGW